MHDEATALNIDLKLL